jgi:Ca-activated chloride channel family protein
MKKSLYLNQICNSLDKERDQFLHLRRLYTIKPTLKIEPPIKPKFLKINRSKILKRAQTQLRIDYENDILYRKISEIKLKKGEYNQNILKPKKIYPAFRRTYFNFKYQDIEKMKNIFEDNIKLKNRLDNAKSYYKTEDINEDAKKQEKYLNNILSKNRAINIPPPLNYYDIDQYKNLVEAQNENENQDENIIKEDEREGDEEEGEEKTKEKKNEQNNKEEKNKDDKTEKNEKENEKEEKDKKNEKEKLENENKNKEESKKNNVSTTNNSTHDKNNAH